MGAREEARAASINRSGVALVVVVAALVALVIGAAGLLAAAWVAQSGPSDLSGQLEHAQLVVAQHQQPLVLDPDVSGR